MTALLMVQDAPHEWARCARCHVSYGTRETRAHLAAKLRAGAARAKEIAAERERGYASAYSLMMAVVESVASDLDGLCSACAPRKGVA